MSDRPTPETDAARHDLSDYGSPVPCSWGDWIHADVASKLERERDEARNKMADALQEVDLRILCVDRMNQECYELRKELEEYRSIAENIGAKKAVSEKEQAIRERDEAREELHDIRLNLGEDADGYTLLHAVCIIQNERDEAREALKRIYQASMVAKSLEEDFAEWEKAIEMLLDLIKKGGALEEIK